MVDQIERELVLPAPPEQVWKVVTGSGWLADDVSFELVPGGEANFTSDDWSKTGWVEDAVPPRHGDDGSGRLTFWWSSDGEPATRVELTLEPDGEGEEATRLRVVEARPLDVLDLTGIPRPGPGGGSGTGPAMLVAA
jgi:uncharacterized protein YndB with AHSA1/START domain